VSAVSHGKLEGTYRVADVGTLDERLAEHDAVLLAQRLAVHGGVTLHGLGKVLETLDPGKVKGHVRGEDRAVEHSAEPARVNAGARGVLLGLGLRRGAEKEAKAVFPQEMDDEHAVHVLEHRLVVVHHRQRDLCVFLLSVIVQYSNPPRRHY